MPKPLDYKLVCQEIRELDPKPSQLKFSESVLAQIEEAPNVFPTDAQRRILDLIHGHLVRKNKSQVEREAEEEMKRLRN